MSCCCLTRRRIVSMGARSGVAGGRVSAWMIASRLRDKTFSTTARGLRGAWRSMLLRVAVAVATSALALSAAARRARPDSPGASGALRRWWSWLWAARSTSACWLRAVTQALMGETCTGLSFAVWRCSRFGFFGRVCVGRRAGAGETAGVWMVTGVRRARVARSSGAGVVGAGVRTGRGIRMGGRVSSMLLAATMSRRRSAAAVWRTWRSRCGYGMTQNAWSVIALGLGAVLLFMFLDAHYLDREKAYRALYEAVAGMKGIPLFSLDPREVDYCEQIPEPQRDNTPAAMGEGPGGQQPPVHTERSQFRFLFDWMPDTSVWKSWAITPFYGSLLAVGFTLLVRAVLK